MSKQPFQLKSMTAYGRGASSFAYGSFTVEIQSVNRRYLEVNINLPKLLARFEIPLRKKVSKRVGRGMVNVFVGWRSEVQTPVKVIPNLSLAKGIKSAWEQIAFELGLEASVGLALLAQEKELLSFEEELPEEEGFLKALEESLDEALDHLLEMKEKEGGALAKDLRERTLILDEYISEIEAHAGDGSEKYRRKLIERLGELLGGSPENEERILREVALFAERVDITEEIVRFRSHATQFRQMLEKPPVESAETRGKTLDFLIQELNREINTIGSKAAAIAVTEQVVKAKGELEKMREQVQNIE
ncbi:MAG: YicC family protein [Chlamydiales bacterium]|nr:YicC family protein [Chlamydiales bacterium]